MEIAYTFVKIVLSLSLISRVESGTSLVLQDAKILAITRQNNGDQFTAEASECSADTCIGLSSGTAGGIENVGATIAGECTCQCHSHLPAFREDLQICVDDIHAAIIDLSGETDKYGPKAKLTAGYLENWVATNGAFEPNTLLMVRFAWSQYYKDNRAFLGYDAQGNKNFPGVAQDAAEWIVKNPNLIGVGTDGPSIDIGSKDNANIAHRLITSVNKYIVEGANIPYGLPECVLSPFVSGSKSQQIPFVFLPLKGQIIHPSKEISFAGIQTPVCAVSGAKFLTDSGWIDLRNPIDTDVPFRLFRDEGRTFLQWVGDTELRNRMGGRLVLVHLMCREISRNDQPNAEIPIVFTPCVAFRVVGTPIKYLSNVSEVIFAPDAQASENNSSGLSVSEYVAIGICSILLGLIYVASVFLYLHLRRRRKENDKNFERRENPTIASAEEGVVKSNPLLGLGRHFVAPDNSFSDSGSSDNDVAPDIIQHHDDRLKNIQVTAAIVHPQHQYDSLFKSLSQVQSVLQDTSNIERLPEENVSIVETIEGREDRDTVKVIGTARRKLYFNPAYFEHQLLVTPPPAALEFLTKIREVISLAKQKMETKKFAPVLIGIPEEDPGYHLDPLYEITKTAGSRRGSVISLKRENSRRRACTGCPGCEPQDFKALSGKLPEFPSLAACQTCVTTNPDSKQISIRKWLEDVPMQSNSSSSDEVNNKPKTVCTKNAKRIRSPARSLSPDHITPHLRTLSPKPASERARSPHYDNKTSSIKSSISSNHSKRSSSTVLTVKNIMKPRAPPPPPPSNPPRLLASKIQKAQLEVQKQIHQTHLEMQKQIESQNFYDTIAEPIRNLPPPDMIHEAMVVDSKAEEPKIPTMTKKKMNAVISQLASMDHLKIDSMSSPDLSARIDYDTDSLERRDCKGYSTPTDYADVSSSQPSPSLSAALPMDEEMTMRNAIINTKTGNMTISKLNMKEVLKMNDLQRHNINEQDVEDHDYELIILKKNEVAGGIYKLPELLQRSNGYSLVSEVYVNNGYNYGSAPSTPSDSNCSTLERAPKIIYEDNQPGHLLIEVEDCPDNYIRVEDSDSFEPDTLDRKPKMKLYPTKEDELVDSLERPNQILLRTTGSFKKENLEDLIGDECPGHLQCKLGSLREIYEAKFKKEQDAIAWQMNLQETDFEGRILTLEERHCKRQRKSIASTPPDVIPPNQMEEDDEAPIYEQPKPPRKVNGVDFKPPLPPKNKNNPTSSETSENCSESSDYEMCVQKPNSDISILKNFIHTDDVLFKNGVNNQFILQAATITTNPLHLRQLHMPIDLRKQEAIKKTWRKVININNNKPDDSGYLSTDSNDSARKKLTNKELLDRLSVCGGAGGGSETDESLGDGHSESGAESIETHSVFFGSYRKSSCIAGSVDSGVGSDLKPAESVSVLEDITSSDSETVSYNTVVPLGSVSSRNSSLIIEQE